MSAAPAQVWQERPWATFPPAGPDWPLQPFACGVTLVTWTVGRGPLLETFQVSFELISGLSSCSISLLSFVHFLRVPSGPFASELSFFLICEFCMCGLW